MADNAIANHLPDAAEALSAFLQTVLDGSAPVQLGEPATVRPADVQAQAGAYAAVLSTSASSPFAVLFEPDWVPLLAEATLGEPLSMESSDAEDLMREVAGQAYGAVQSKLAGAGLALSAVTFDVRPPGATLPEWAGDLVSVPFTLERGDKAFGGFAVIPAPEPAPSAPSVAAPSPPRSAARPPTEGQLATVARAAFPDLGAEQLGGDGDTGFALLAEVQLEVTVELGRRKLPLADLLHLTNGSIIELEKLVGEPLEVYANGRLIAEGEAVVIDEQFGVRITSLAARQRDRAFL